MPGGPLLPVDSRPGRPAAPGRGRRRDRIPAVPGDQVAEARLVRLLRSLDLPLDQALSAAKDIAEDGEREIVLADLETIPGQPRYW